MAATNVTNDYVRPFLATALPVCLLAGPIAVLWAHVVPHAGVVVDDFGDVLAAGRDNEFIRADGWFLVMALIVGALCGAVTWWFAGGRSPGALVGLAGGSIFAAFAVARIGQQHNAHKLQLASRVRHAGVTTALHEHYPPLAHGVLFAWAFAAVLVYGVLTAIVTRR